MPFIEVKRTRKTRSVGREAAEATRAFLQEEGRRTRDEIRAGQRVKTGALRAATKYQTTILAGNVVRLQIDNKLRTPNARWFRADLDNYGLRQGRLIRWPSGARSTYADSSRNRALGRAGQPYREVPGTGAWEAGYRNLRQRLRSRRRSLAAAIAQRLNRG